MVKTKAKEAKPAKKDAKQTTKPMTKTTGAGGKPTAKASVVVKAKSAPASTKKAVKAAVKVVVKAKTKTASGLRPCTTRFTATEVLQKACDAAGIERKQGKSFMDWQTNYVAACLMNGGVGSAKLLGWNFKSTKVPAKKVPAIKKGAMVKNPFTGEETPHKGRAAFTKPASMRTKALALKAVKDMIAGTSK